MFNTPRPLLPASEEDPTFERKTRKDALKARILALQVEIAAVSRELNSSAEISRLPDEILCHIFLCLVNIRQHISHIHLSPQDTAMSLTYICHHWRKVALGYSQLWATIHITSRSELVAAAAALRLSGGALLDISLRSDLALDVQGNFDLKLVKEVFHEMHRIRRLHITDSPLREDIHGLSPPQAYHLGGPQLPYLYTLSIDYLAFYPFEDHPSFLAPLLERSPNLRTLKIWTGPRGLQHLKHVSSLVNLTISIPEAFTGEHTSLDDLVGVLALLPRLQTLDVSVHTGSYAPEWLVARKKLALPQLRRLNFSGPSSNCVLFLESVKLTSLDYFSAHVGNRDNFRLIEQRFIEAILLVASLMNIDNQCARLGGLELYSAPYQGWFALALYGTSSPFGDWEAMGPRFRLLGLAAFSILSKIDSLFSEVTHLWCRDLDFLSYDEISLPNAPTNAQEFYAFLFEKLCHVRELHVQHEHVDDRERALEDYLFENDREGRVASFPGLQKIFLTFRWRYDEGKTREWQTKIRNRGNRSLGATEPQIHVRVRPGECPWEALPKE